MLRYAQSFVLFSRFVIVVLLLPVTQVAVIAEILAFRAWIFHALGVALLTAAMPFAVMPELIQGFPFVSPATGLLAAAARWRARSTGCWPAAPPAPIHPPSRIGPR